MTESYVRGFTKGEAFLFIAWNIWIKGFVSSLLHSCISSRWTDRIMSIVYFYFKTSL